MKMLIYGLFLLLPVLVFSDTITIYESCPMTPKGWTFLHAIVNPSDGSAYCTYKNTKLPDKQINFKGVSYGPAFSHDVSEDIYRCRQQDPRDCQFKLTIAA